MSSPIQSKHRAKEDIELNLSTSGAPENHCSPVRSSMMPARVRPICPTSREYEYERDRVKGVGQKSRPLKLPNSLKGRVAIVLDNYVYTAPTVQG